MMSSTKIIGSAAWLDSAPGRYLLAWEQSRLDRLVADIFGFHALQLGWPALQGLRTNRMQHRWLLSPQLPPDNSPPLPGPPEGLPLGPLTGCVRAEFEALPFPAESLDLVLLPHTLELAADPHQTLREVERVLRPEGRVIVLGFNPASAWGLRWQLDGLLRRCDLGQEFLPHEIEPIGWLRLRDWLRLMGLQITGGHFGCYRPPLRSEAWLERSAWLEGVGQRWWPVFGSVYLLVAIKRVHGMRLLGTPWKRRARQGRAAPVLNRQQPHPTHHSRYPNDQNP